MLKLTKISVAIFVSIQLGILIPLAPVFAQMAEDNTIAPDIENLILGQNAEKLSESIKETLIPEINQPEESNSASEIIAETSITTNSTITEALMEEKTTTTAETDVTTSTPAETTEPEKVKEEEKDNPPLNYVSLMRQVKEIKKGSLENLEIKKTNTVKDLEKYISQEKDRLDKLDVPNKKQKAYFKLLEKQVKAIDNRPATFFQKVFGSIKDFFGLEEDNTTSTENNLEDVKIPENPGSFTFNNDVVQTKKIDLTVYPENGQKIDKSLLNLIKIEKVSADTSALPTIEDVKTDNGEIIINSNIRDLSNSLNNNPVEIYNFVRENIKYEPYFGSKKGNLGCLAEKICNDVDTASLTISLLRAAGIPARYKKAVAVISVNQLKSLLGVDETKTVYGALKKNKIPTFIISGNAIGENLDDADFSNETSFGVEWTFPEAYYEYDERGANIDNTLSLENISSTEQLLSTLQNYPKKQWIPMDLIVKPYVRTQKEIVLDTISFNTETFWKNYLSYQGSLSSFDKLVSDIQTATGKNIKSETYQTKNNPVNKKYEILPPTLPYLIGSGVDEDGNQVNIESWSVLPDAKKIQVKIQLKNTNDDQVILEKTFNGSEINNKEIELQYEGLTDTDKQTIESYGGIAYTPTSLVDIKPFFLGNTERYDSEIGVAIGDPLLLRFEYILNGQTLHDDEKFSVAGNQEGIFVVLSQVQTDPYLDTNSNILLRGNVGIAREYLRKITDDGKNLSQALDYTFNYNFARAVVTQNRVLSKVNNTPTTFDFKGLTIDATSYINDWSNRGNYKNHHKDFRLVYGQNASFYEGQIFNDIAGLNGISTVKGLQFASAHPETYTVHTITSANENLIDSLALSDNTKANMHADVQKGNTIITPNKFIVDQNWNGLVYISLDPEWTGTYAIGEQTQQNGGWTTSGFQIIIVTVDDKEVGQFVNEGTSNNFIYSDGSYGVSPKICKISKVDFIDIMTNQNWQENYGLPCTRGKITYSDLEHAYGDFDYYYDLTTNATRFYTSDGSYGPLGVWIKENTVNSKFNSLASNYSSGKKFTFKFSSILGTYIQAFCTSNDFFTGCYDWNTGSIYFSPDSNQGAAYLVVGDFLEKLDDNKNFVVQKIGYATASRGQAAEYPGETFYLRDTNGQYQNFVNGQIYKNENWYNEIMYVPGKISKCFNTPSICGQSGNGGTGGYFGFPINDPERGTDGSWYQAFQNNKEINLKIDGQIQVVGTRYYRCQIYGDVKNPLKLSFYTAHGIWNGISDTISGVFVDLPMLIWGVIKTIGLSVANPIDSYQETKEIISDLAQISREITWQQVWESVKNSGDQSLITIKNELDSSECIARESYMGGFLIGSAVSVSKLIKGVKWGKSLPGHFKTALLKVTKKIDKFSFRSDDLFKSHFADHATEFGIVSPSDYLNRANKLLSSNGSDILAKIRKSDGAVIKYKPDTNEFIVLSQDGYIKTYFKPNPAIHGYSTNLEYFKSQ